MKTIFDVEHMQQLTYERSKKWSTFLENLTKNETLDEIPICEVDSFYGPECDESDTNDDLVSMEDSDCNEPKVYPAILRNLTNNKILSLPLTGNINTTTEEDTKIVDMLNETLPIVYEHNRQLKETGFDKILSTFDKNKIEEKVGGWLNRHNSLYGGDASLLSDEIQRKHGKVGRLITHKENNKRIKSIRKPNSSNQEESYSSDDSLQSDEIARYIRSSRAASLRKSTSNKTMIKTYRLVKSTRDALREKYACEKDNGNDYHHCHRIRSRLEYHHNHYDLIKKSRYHKHEMLSMSTAYKQKRKILRKRLATQSYDISDSSASDDDDDYAEQVHRRMLPYFCNQYCSAVRNTCSAVKVPSSTVKRTQRSALKMSPARLNRIYCFSPYTLSKSLSSSTSSNSFSKTLDSSCIVKTKNKCYTEMRPFKHESECSCRNEGKLCEEYLHITDKSTEEWYVENCGTPKKIIKQRTPVAKRTHLLGVRADNHSSDNENVYSGIKRKIEEKTQNVESSSRTKQIEKLGKRKQKTNETKDAPEKVEDENKFKATSFDETFERELQKAIEMSKELFEKEQQLKTKEGKKTKTRPRKPVMKTTSQREEHNAADNISKEEKRTTRKTGATKKDNNASDEEEVIKKSHEMLQSKSDNNISQNQHDENQEHAILKSQNEQQINCNTTEDTFFTSERSQVICNSTAMSTNNHAYKRQITSPIAGASEQLIRNDISKINDETNNTHDGCNEDSIRTTSVKMSTRKTKRSKSTKCDQYQINYRNISDSETNDKVNNIGEDSKENYSTTNKAKKPDRKLQVSHDSSCIVKTKTKCYTEMKPFKRESECSCRNEGKLCEEYLHFTDTSTEEWYVENCTPKKTIKQQTPHADVRADNHSSDNENVHNGIKRKIEEKTQNVASSSRTKQIEKLGKIKQKTNETKDTPAKAENENKVKATSVDETFERALQKAIEMSKELFAKEQQLKTKEGKKTKARPRKPVVKTTSQKEEYNAADNISKEEKRTARKRRITKQDNNANDEEEVIKKSHEMLQSKSDNNISQKQHDENQEHAILKSKNEQQISGNTTEDTIFTSERSQVICNSTAMSTNSHAYKRQITSPTAGASVQLTRNDISKINDETNNIHDGFNEDSIRTRSVKMSTRKTKSSKSTKCDQYQVNYRNISDSETNDKVNNIGEDSKENYSTTKKAKKSNRKLKVSISDNLTLTRPSQSQVKDIDNSDLESSNEDNTVIFLKASKECNKINLGKEQEQQSSKKVSQHNDRKQIKTTATSSRANVSSTIKSSNNTRTAKPVEISTVTSTTKRSPNAPSSLIQSYVKNHAHVTLFDDDDANDALVTSTTNFELPTLTATILENTKTDLQPTTSSHKAHSNLLANAQHSDKGILIYSPHNHNLALAHTNVSDGYFTITKQHLSSIIGEKAAEKFIKYYVGRKRFNSNSTIYYRPPTTRTSNMSSSSDSDDDLESWGQYGDLYESLNKS